MSISRTGTRRSALAEVRRATAADHAALDELIDARRLVCLDHYAAVMAGLIAAAEIIEAELPAIPYELRCNGLSPCLVSKRSAIDAEKAFLQHYARHRAVPQSRRGRRQPIITRAPARAATLGVLYVYLGSALGGAQMLRIAQAAPWWDGEREQLLLRPYGRHLAARWRTLQHAVERLEPDETSAAVAAARAAFDAHAHCLAESLATAPGRRR